MYQLHAIRALVVSVRSSFSPSSERHTFVNSYIATVSSYSSAERIGRRLSDISLGSADKLKSRRETKPLSSHSSRRQVIFSPIHEHNGIVSDLHTEENVSIKLTGPNTINGVCHQSNKDLNLQCTEV